MTSGIHVCWRKERKAEREDRSQMKRAAIGVRAHSGWGALVAVCNNGGDVEVIARTRVAVSDPNTPGAKQPFHFAKKLGPVKAEKYLADCTRATQRLATEAIREIVRELQHREYRIVGSAILMSSGRPLPALPQILVSHALIHMAEGEFFRCAFREAFEELEIGVTAISERELEARAKIALGAAASRTGRRIESLGRALGPPWTQDQKTAALAAAMVLAA